jgi:3,4-dihydroxy 2-butanone 4-phosphate synthase
VQEARRSNGQIDPIPTARSHTAAAGEGWWGQGKKQPVGVICELVVDGKEVPGQTQLVGGGMMRKDNCLAFGKKWGIKVCTIEDMVKYIVENEKVLNMQ